MTSSASWPVSVITSATVRLSQRRFSGRRKAPSRTSAQPAALAYDAPRAVNSARTRSRAVLSARRSLSGSRSAGLDPLRELDEQSRRRPLRGVGVERDVEPFGARVVDQREHRFGWAGVCLAVVEVRDVGRSLGPPADLDRLAERIEVAVAERIPNVGVVEAAVPAGLFREHGELLGRRVPTGRVIESRAEPERAIGHRVGEHATHPGERRGVGRDVVPAQVRRSGAANSRPGSRR